MRKFGLAVGLVVLLLSSNLLGQSLKGLYKGTYKVTTNYNLAGQTTTEYEIRLRFDDDYYYVTHTFSDLCAPYGRYDLNGGVVDLVQYYDGCGSQSSEPLNNPFGDFGYSITNDSLILTQVSGDTLKELRLEDRTSQYELAFYSNRYSVAGENESMVVPIYLTNSVDSIEGFTFWVQLSNPEIGEFSMEFDTSGTLISGWDIVETNSLGGNNYDIKVLGIANVLVATNPPIVPQDGDIPLIKLRFNTYTISEIVTDRSVNMLFISDFSGAFGLSDPWGNAIELAFDTVLDTSCFVCQQWSGDECLSWTQVPNGLFECDSIFVGLDTVAYLDSSRVYFEDYTTLFVPKCGNVNGFDSQVDITDLLYLVDFMFAQPSGPAPWSADAADVDGSGGVDISDLLALVDFMFGTGGISLDCL